MQNKKSPHILNAASNLLGLCFVVLTSLRVLGLSDKTHIDEIVAAALVLFMLSCLLSFLSIRGNIKSGSLTEALADYLFLGGMIVLFITALMIIFNIVN